AESIPGDRGVPRSCASWARRGPHQHGDPRLQRLASPAAPVAPGLSALSDLPSGWNHFAQEPSMTPDKKSDPNAPRVVKGDQNFTLDRAAFRTRFYERFNDPMYDDIAPELEKVFEVTWQNYTGYRKSPRKQKAGPGFAEPDYELPMEWLETRR